MVRYIFKDGKVYADDGEFSPIRRKSTPRIGTFGLLVLINERGEPFIPGQGEPDV